MIEVKIYDWQTPFNNVPVSVINPEFEKQWGRDAQIALVYRDSVFTGIAEPLTSTIEAAVKHYEEHFAQLDAQDAAARQAANTPANDERIAAALEALMLLNM